MSQLLFQARSGIKPGQPGIVVLDSYTLDQGVFEQWIAQLNIQLGSLPAEGVPLVIRQHDPRSGGFWLLREYCTRPVAVFQYMEANQIQNSFAAAAYQLSQHFGEGFFPIYLDLWKLFHRAARSWGTVVVNAAP